MHREVDPRLNGKQCSENYRALIDNRIDVEMVL
jgi:hypothetical protein